MPKNEQAMDTLFAYWVTPPSFDQICTINHVEEGEITKSLSNREGGRLEGRGGDKQRCVFGNLWLMALYAYSIIVVLPR